MSTLSRLALSLISLPLTLVGRGVHRLATGATAIVDVTVTPTLELRDRQRFLHRLERLADDPLVAGVLLRLQGPWAGWAALQDLRARVLAIRQRGTPVYAFVEAPGNGLTWVASACDRVFMVPTGELRLVGVGVELTFFGDALKRLGVRPDLEAAGAYKSFGEPYTRSFPSAENHEAVSALVADLHEQLVEGIAQGRSRTPAEIEALVAEAPLSAEEALREGLVDQLAYPDELEDWVKENHGEDAKLLSFSGWAFRDRALEALETAGVGSASVAVVHLQGPIVVEEGSRGPVIAARKVAPLVKRLREDDQVSAVVLHIDSPGGSALASDLIWREVAELRKQKPVVASFEDTAASGGYYLAAPATEILVRPGTITGSIGVFGGKLVLAEGLRRVGVHHREVLGAPNANLFTPTRHFTEAQRTRFRESLQRFYDGFVSRVADGRGKPVDEVEPHCRGRVWTGTAALARGLADRVGDLDEAVHRATALAGLSAGDVRRREVVGHQVPWPARAVQSALRRAAAVQGWLPSVGLAWLQRLVPSAVSPVVDVLLAHPEEPLALITFDPDPLRPR